MFLCSMTSELPDIGVFLPIDTGVILIGDISSTYHCVILAEMKMCQISKWFVRKWGIKMSHILKVLFC